MDSGTFQYVGAEAERDRFRGTEAHNTLVIARRDQAEPAGPFSWERLPNVRAEGWIAGKSFDLFVGSHDGYTRLPNPVLHRRFVFSLKSGFWLVRDVALGFGDYQLDIFWHIGAAFVAQEDSFAPEKSGFRLVTVKNHGWTRSLEHRPDSPAYGKESQHRVLHFSTRAQLPAEFVTLMVPLAEHSEAELTAIAPQSTSVAGYRYKAGPDVHSMFFGQGRDWRLERWSSDAEFLYSAQVGPNAAETLICCKATYVDWNGRRILSAKRPVLRCEITGGQELISTDPDAVALDKLAWKALAGNRSSEFAVKLT
jgi:hypothetical protein